MKRILITSPSLNTKENVSGISTLVADIIQFSNFNFVHFQLGSKDGLKKNLVWALRQVNIYIQIFFTSIFRKFEIVHLNIGLEKFSIIRDSLILYIVKLIFRKKVILHVHGGYYLMNKPDNALLSFMLKKNFQYAETIIVLSELEKNILTERYGNLSFHVFPNAVDTASINGASGKRVENDKMKFIFMGRINKSKGIYTISESLRLLSSYYDQFTLDIYGSGPDQDEWLATLEAIPGLQYNYKGVVGGNDKWNALCAADVFLLPSLHSEGLPIAMIEAMAAGCAVIVTDVASIKTVIDDNVNGILLSESSAGKLSGKMEDIILNKIDYKSIGENGKAYVNKNLSLPSYIFRLENLYADL
jgi:glycosyltransferase involved in cell wall biosynthesis